MDRDQSPPVQVFLPAAIILGIFGWGGLGLVVYFTPPTVGPRWLFFFFSVLAVTSISLPLAAFLNLRFSSTPPASSGVILRQALWVGIYLPTLAWLLAGGVLNLSSGLLLAVGLVLIELLLRLREKSQWKP